MGMKVSTFDKVSAFPLKYTFIELFEKKKGVLNVYVCKV